MMNLADYASNLYSAYHSNPSGGYARTPEEKEKLENFSREEFVEDMLKTHKERWASGGDAAARHLYAGSASRAKLSDAEIAVLANKYDPRSMDGKTYDAFLDDLESMGAISENEKGFLGYGGLITAGYFDANGNLILNGHSRSGSSSGGMDFSPQNGDVAGWLAERAQWKAGGNIYPGNPSATAESERSAQRENEMYAALNNIMSRMAAARGESAGTDSGPESIVSQIADPASSFYQDMFARMKLQMQQSEEEKEKQAIIDALDAILESLSAKDDDKQEKKSTVRSMAGLSQVIDSLDRYDPRKDELNLLRERLQQLGIYADLDVGIKDKDKSWETLTQSLIREENQSESPSLFDII